MDTEITSKNFEVRFSDCDLNCRLKLSSLFLFMEETSIADIEHKGFGFWKMLQMGYTWMITRIKVRIIHTPLLGEKLSVSTWVKDIYKDKVILKDFSILDSENRTIAVATSSWLLVNLKTGKSESPTNLPFPIPIIFGKNALPEVMDILTPNSTPTLVYTEEARYSDLDINKHVHHCRYVDWVFDVLGLEEIKERGIRSIQMNYMKQIPLGAKVHLFRFKNSNHHAFIFGMNSNNPTLNLENGNCYFQASVGFEK